MTISKLVYEEWKDIKGYEGLYQVSSFGRIKSLNYHQKGIEQTLKLSSDKDGYKQVILYKDGSKRNFRVHRLVAEAFIDNPDNLPLVNHKNEFKYDNFVDNLEYCDEQYNSNYGSRNNKVRNSKYGTFFTELHKQRISKAKKIPVLQFTMDNEFIRKWEGIVDASRELNICDGHISGCCKGKLKSIGGFKWRYAEE